MVPEPKKMHAAGTQRHLSIFSLNKFRCYFCYTGFSLPRFSSMNTMKLINMIQEEQEVADDLSAAIHRTIKSRRTIHKFRPTPLPTGTIERAVEIARWAPNHKLTEPWRFYMLGEETVRNAVALNERLILAGKPQEIIQKKRTRWLTMPSTTLVTFKKTGDELRNREDYAATCCAIHNFSLYLWSQGIGTKWSTARLIRQPEFYELLGLDMETEETVGLLWAGYPQDIPEKHRSPTDAILCALP